MKSRSVASVPVVGLVLALQACGIPEEGDSLAQQQEALGDSAAAIFFHGMDVSGASRNGWGRAEGNTWAYAPDLYAITPAPNAFYPNVWQWKDYGTVSGYSLGRKPMLNYLKQRGGSVRRAVLFDPSAPDAGVDYGASVIRPWLAADPARRMLLLIGPLSEPRSILDQYIRSVKGTPEWLRLDVCHVSTAHLDFPRQHFAAITNPAYRPGWCE